MPNWLDQLREVLGDYYPAPNDGDIVGYLKGSGEPGTWQAMARQQQPQMLILGSIPPNQDEWTAAGKRNGGIVQTVRAEQLRGLIVLYGGFVYRPWGRIELLDSDALRHYQVATIESFRRNKPNN